MIYETFLFNREEFKIHIGKNAQENWDLIDASTPDDIWFHIKDLPSSHVFLRTNRKLKCIPRNVLIRCACLCKQKSQSKSMKNCEIIYTEISNVKKGVHIGETIAKSTHFIRI